MSNTNFTAAVENAVATVASLLNEPVAKIAKQALIKGSIQGSVMMLVFNGAKK